MVREGAWWVSNMKDDTDCFYILYILYTCFVLGELTEPLPKVSAFVERDWN